MYGTTAKFRKLIVNLDMAAKIRIESCFFKDSSTSNSELSDWSYSRFFFFIYLPRTTTR